MKIINPYRPGAGLMPGVLAGRETLIENSTDHFEALKAGVPVQSIAFSGYRGVGKTVLLNKLQEIAEDHNISGYHIEIERTSSFIAKLSDSCKKFIRNNSALDKAKSVMTAALDALKSLEISYSPESSDFKLSMQERALYSTTDLSQGLQDLFCSIGELARKKKNTICFFIDEFQYISQEEMDAFISALHRANQLSLPVMAVCAGTPEMIKMLYKEKTYVERLFIFPKLEMLNASEVATAIAEPGQKVGLSFTDDALEEIYRITEGYPYFVQQYGQLLCNNLSEDKKVTLASVKGILDKYYNELDNNFYMVRFNDRGALEKECLIAIAQADRLPCNISFISGKIGKTTKQIAPTLSRLKNKGLITFENINDIDFTVPGFSDYIKRNHI
ncbi:MAG: AAA family ATPase [Oribacterium sp.]|nr:AAA family ATPase [Oribacterium sp.]